jgi:hypothetical protein
MKLTKINIARVAVPSGKSEIIEFDDNVPGFGLRVRSGGSATWIFQYRQGNKQRRLSLGSAAAITAQHARDQASQLHARVRLGQDPAGVRLLALTGQRRDVAANLVRAERGGRAMGTDRPDAPCNRGMGTVDVRG